MVLTAVVCVEVFKRYIMNMPTAWIFDLDNMLYGTLFMMCGAYTLAQNAHVRGDFLYSSMKPRTQASLDLVLYIVFFIPGIAALIYAGYRLCRRLAGASREHSNVTADGPPVYQFKSVIPIAGALVMLQGIAEIVRCVVCLRTGEWPSRLKDVEEIDVIEEQLAHSEYVDEESRKIAIERAQEIDEAARQRGMGGRLEHMSDPALGLSMLALIVVVIMMGFPTAFTLMGLGMFFGFIALYDPTQSWARQPRVRPDGPAHLRRHDQRRADLDPAVRADGLRDGARRARRQDVLLDPARVPAACRPRSPWRRSSCARSGASPAVSSAPSWC